jgi:hypothetical protein
MFDINGGVILPLNFVLKILGISQIGFALANHDACISVLQTWFVLQEAQEACLKNFTFSVLNNGGGWENFDAFIFASQSSSFIAEISSNFTLLKFSKIQKNKQLACSGAMQHQHLQSSG